MPSKHPEAIHFKLLPWFKKHGRKNLPWQIIKTPYIVWLSETMLQQTQVSTVIPYFLNFLNQCPDIFSLAQLDHDSLMNLWSGLGYYSRARNLHQTAQIIVAQYQGEFPQDIQLLMALPGIGPSTAAAIMSLAFNKRHPILDGNVKRVLCRYHGLAVYPEETQAKKKLWALADYHMSHDAAAYSQGIMDLGAMICTPKQPLCEQCPLRTNCIALREDTVTEIPKPKPKKNTPTREQYFMVFINEQTQVLLEKRPNTGIWGGLWSFPESSEKQLAIDFAVEHYAVKNISHQLPSFKHIFTHFKLIIHPLIFRVSGSHTPISRQSWYTLTQEHTIGLATPVSKILNQLLEHTA